MTCAQTRCALRYLLAVILCVLLTVQAQAQPKEIDITGKDDFKPTLERIKEANLQNFVCNTTHHAPTEKQRQTLGGLCMPTLLYGDEWFATYWSWAHWWEANAYQILKPKEDRSEELMRDDDSAKAALISVLKSNKNPKVLAQAVYALGRMRCSDATDQIIELLNHPNQTVRRNSWIALGLIEDKQATTRMMQVLDTPTLEPEDAAAWIVAIGMMQKPDEKLLQALVPIITQVNLTEFLAGYTRAHRNEALIQGRMAMWALRMHNPEGINIVARRVLGTSTDPMLFHEAIQALAANPDDAIFEKIFNPTYQNRPVGWRTMPTKAMSLAAFQHVTPFADSNDDEITAMRTSIAIAYDNQAIAYQDNSKRLVHVINRTLRHNYAIVFERDMQHDSKYKNKSNWPRNTRFYKNDYWRHRNTGVSMCNDDIISYALRYALIPRGRYGDFDLDKNDDPEDAQFLCDVLLGKYTVGSSHNELNPSRGFAAMAMGLYLTRMPNDTTLIRHDKQRKIVRYIDRLLTRIATDPDEPNNIRAACVIALGMGQLRQSVEYVAVNNQDAVVNSYAAVALGMTGSPLVLQIAKQSFKKDAQAVDVTVARQGVKLATCDPFKMLLKRQMLRGMACLGDPQANVLLFPRLLDNLYDAQQMIQTLKWTGDMTVTDALIELLEDSGKQPELESFCAWALGELYDPNMYPIAQQRLMLGRNPTLLPVEANTELGCNGRGEPTLIYVRHAKTQRYLELVDPFFFKVLIHGTRG